MEKEKKSPKNIIRAIVIGVIIGFIITTIFSTAYNVDEGCQGVVLTFGKPTSVVSPGLNFKIPYVQEMIPVDMRVQGLAIGYNEDTNTSTNDSSMITSDFNFVNIDFFVEWSVSDPIKALYSAKDPVDILVKAVQSSARAVVGKNTVDNVLTSGKAEIQTEMMTNVSEFLDTLDLGIQVHSINIQDAETPTTDIQNAFKAVETAKQEKETIVNDATAYKNAQIPAARAEADKLLQAAEADKMARVNEATAQVARFNAMFEEYQKNKDITKKRMFFEYMEDILPNMEVIIENADGSTEKMYPVKSFGGI